MEEKMKVEQIDHIHIYVSDKIEAANWYKKVLGFEPINKYENPLEESGPYTLSSDGGNTNIALFINRDNTKHKNTIAYKISGNNFINFVEQLNSLEVKNVEGNLFSKKDIIDHQYSFSIYFYDPYSNPIEIITYHYDLVKHLIATSNNL